MPAVADPIHFPEGEHAKRDALRNFSLARSVEIGSIANIPSVQQTEDEL
jgi:hypothetical protein